MTADSVHDVDEGCHWTDALAAASGAADCYVDRLEKFYAEQNNCVSSGAYLLGDEDMCVPAQFCSQLEMLNDNGVPCYAEFLKQTIDDIEKGDEELNAHRDEFELPSAYFLDRRMVSPDAHCLEEGVDQETRDHHNGCHRNSSVNDRCILSSKGSFQSAGTVVNQAADDWPTSRRMPSVPLSTAQQNYQSVTAGQGPLQPNSWQGCKKSAWCNRENRHRGICNNRAAIPGLAAYGVSINDTVMEVSQPPAPIPQPPATPARALCQQASKQSTHTTGMGIVSDDELTESEPEPELDYGETTEEDDDEDYQQFLETSISMDDNVEDGDGVHSGQVDPNDNVKLPMAVDGAFAAQSLQLTQLLHTAPSPPLGHSSSEATTQSYDDASEDDNPEVGTGHHSDQDTHSTIGNRSYPGSPFRPAPEENPAAPESPATAKSGSGGNPSFERDRGISGLISRCPATPTADLLEEPLPPQSQPIMQPSRAPALVMPVEVQPRETKTTKVSPSVELGGPVVVAQKVEAKKTGPKNGAGGSKGKGVRAGQKVVGGGVKAKRRQLNKGSGEWQRGNRAMPGQKCEFCGAETTPVWRAGPNGPKTLCNACGVRHMKSSKRPSR